MQLGYTGDDFFFFFGVFFSLTALWVNNQLSSPASIPGAFADYFNGQWVQDAVWQLAKPKSQWVVAAAAASMPRSLNKLWQQIGGGKVKCCRAK